MQKVPSLMNKNNLTVFGLPIAVLIIIVAGTGYYFWNMPAKSAYGETLLKALDNENIVSPEKIVGQFWYCERISGKTDSLRDKNIFACSAGSEHVVYIEDSSDAFRHLRRRGFGQKFRLPVRSFAKAGTEILNFDNFKFFFGGKS